MGQRIEGIRRKKWERFSVALQCSCSVPFLLNPPQPAATCTASSQIESTVGGHGNPRRAEGKKQGARQNWGVEGMLPCYICPGSAARPPHPYPCPLFLSRAPNPCQWPTQAVLPGDWARSEVN